MSKDAFLQGEKYVVSGEHIIEDVVDAFPIVGLAMRNYGLHCVGCSASKFDTIVEGCKLHKLSDQTITQLLGEINVLVNQQFEITPVALAKIAQHRIQEEADWPLRISAKKQGCDLVYELNYDTTSEQDTKMKFGEVELVFDAKSLAALTGAKLDFDIKEKGFVFVLPSPTHQDGSLSCPRQEELVLSSRAQP